MCIFSAETYEDKACVPLMDSAPVACQDDHAAFAAALEGAAGYGKAYTRVWPMEARSQVTVPVLRVHAVTECADSLLLAQRFGFPN